METFIKNNKFSISEKESRFKLNRYVLFLLLILLVSIILSGAASAAIVPVNSSANSIKNAINTAHSGDT